MDQSGPYGAELGDLFLNRMIAAGTPPDQAVAEYLRSTCPLRRIDRMLELLLEKQRNRDAACGFQIADHIEAQFRTPTIPDRKPPDDEPSPLVCGRSVRAHWGG